MSSSSASKSSSSEILAAHRGISAKVPIDQLFTRKELVGKGAYGGVYKGIHNPTGLVVALKVIDLDTPDDDITEIQKEVALLSEMRDAARHNITLYHGCYLNGYELWIAMDFASGGSIRTLMKSGTIEEKYTVLIMREVLVALSFLHRQSIIHRDVKAANILLTQAGKILLCDFGVAAHLQTNNKRSTFIGTPLWMAPEVITDGKMYDTKADIWSLGVTLYEIATGNPPYFGMEPLRACALIPRSQPARLEGGTWSNPMRDFLATCLQVDPTTRPTADELSRHKWIKTSSKLPMSLLLELISRYVSWIQMGGQRASIAGLDSPLKREDTFDIDEEDMWDFEEEKGDDLGFEPLGDEPPRSLDAQAAINQLRPQKPNRNHPLLRLFDEESNPYAQTSNITAIQLPSGPAGIDTVKPTISIPSFDDMDDMYGSKAPVGSFGHVADDLMTPATIRGNPFSWTQQSSASTSSGVLDSPKTRHNTNAEYDWASEPVMTPTDSTFFERSARTPVPSSPSMPSMASNRPFLDAGRRRADTTPSSDYPPLGPGIPAPMRLHCNDGSHSSTNSMSSFGSMYMSASSGSTSASTSYTNLTSSPPSISQQRFGTTPSNQAPLNFSRSRPLVGSDKDVNRPFRARQGSDATPVARPFRLGTAPSVPGVASLEGRPRTGSDSSNGSGVRPMGLHEKRGLKLHINTSSAGSNGSVNSSSGLASAHSRTHSRTGSGVLSYNFTPSVTTAFSYSSAVPLNGVIKETEVIYDTGGDDDRYGRDFNQPGEASQLHWTDPAFIARFGGTSAELNTPLAREHGAGAGSGSNDFPFPTTFGGGPGGAIMMDGEENVDHEGAGVGRGSVSDDEDDDELEEEDEGEGEDGAWMMTGPPLRALDYAKLVTAIDVEIELDTTLSELGQWLELVDSGLERILGGGVAGSGELGRDVTVAA